jgi:hypothetical protein
MEIFIVFVLVVVPQEFRPVYTVYQERNSYPAPQPWVPELRGLRVPGYPGTRVGIPTLYPGTRVHVYPGIQCTLVPGVPRYRYSVATLSRYPVNQSEILPGY